MGWGGRQSGTEPRCSLCLLSDCSYFLQCPGQGSRLSPVPRVWPVEPAGPGRVAPPGGGGLSWEKPHTPPAARNQMNLPIRQTGVLLCRYCGWRDTQSLWGGVFWRGGARLFLRAGNSGDNILEVNYTVRTPPLNQDPGGGGKQGRGWKYSCVLSEN